MRGSVSLKVRPLRLAFLVDPDNVAQVRAAIQSATSLWGGVFFPIIPIHKRVPKRWRHELPGLQSARAIVEGYIEAFDPDALVVLCKEVPAYIHEFQIDTIALQDLWHRRPTYKPVPEPSYGISILDLLRGIYDEHFRYKTTYPVRFVIPKIPKTSGLFWASVFGDYDPEIMRFIKDEWGDAFFLEQSIASVENYADLTEPEILFPRRITETALERSGNLRFGKDACVFFMDDTKVQDIVDFWNLRATGRNVVPIPKSLLHSESLQKLVAKFLIQNRLPWPHQPENFDVVSFIRSRNTKMEEMSAYAASLPLPKISSPSPGNSYLMLQHWYPRLWDSWARPHDGGILDVYHDNERVIDIHSISDLELRLRPLLPKFLSHDYVPSSHGVCANELDFNLYGADQFFAEVYPRVHGEHLQTAIEGLMRREWRIGRNGLVKLVQHSIAETRTIPQSSAVFFAWLRDRGWTAELSPPGILANELFKRMDGNTPIFVNKKLLTLLEHMNGGSVNKDGLPIGDTKDIEREISVAEVKSRLGGKSKNFMLYEHLLKKEVFRLGLKAQCPNCQRGSWFSLSALSEKLECPKCLNSFPAAGNIDQTKGGWYYRTTGPFSVPNYADGAYTVLLTIHALSAHLLSYMRTTPVPSFVAKSEADDRVLEADLAMLWKHPTFGRYEEGVLFGECKTYGLFEKKDIERMAHIGAAFPGAILVFSTLRELLTRKEIASLRRLAASGRRKWKSDKPLNPVMILTGKELLSAVPPPHCWVEDGSTKNEMRIDGMLSLCDATQQRYLHLPPWHEERRARNAARHSRRKIPLK